MFTQSTTSESLTNAIIEPKPAKSKALPNIYPNQHNSYSTNEMNSQNIDAMLEKEKQSNKIDTWNKLDKTAKIQRLHSFAEKYGKDNGYPVKDIKSLKMFFTDCLEKNKLQKAKDLIYDKESGIISSIPSLHFNSESHNFTLRITDSKRVSTLKSLTPKRVVALVSPVALTASVALDTSVVPISNTTV